MKNKEQVNNLIDQTLSKILALSSEMIVNISEIEDELQNQCAVISALAREAAAKLYSSALLLYPDKMVRMEITEQLLASLRERIIEVIATRESND